MLVKGAATSLVDPISRAATKLTDDADPLLANGATTSIIHNEATSLINGAATPLVNAY